MSRTHKGKNAWKITLLGKSLHEDRFGWVDAVWCEKFLDMALSKAEEIVFLATMVPLPLSVATTV